MDPVTLAATALMEVIDLIVKAVGKDAVTAALSGDVIARDKAISDYVMLLKFGPPKSA